MGIINSDSSKPFAFRTKLGWVIGGTVKNKTGGSKVKMYRISMKNGIKLDGTLIKDFNRDLKIFVGCVMKTLIGNINGWVR